MKPIDTKVLIEEIEAEIEQGSFEQSLPKFQKRKPTMIQLHPNDYKESVIDADLLHKSKNVTLLYGFPNSFKGIILKVFRKIVTPIMHPAFSQQNIFNENVDYTFELLDGEIQDLKKLVKKQQEEIEELKRKL